MLGPVSVLLWRVIGAFCLVMAARPVTAQVAGTTQADLRTVVGIADNRHWYVRIETADGSQFEGNVARVPGDAVRVGSLDLPLTSVRAFYRRTTEDSGARRGMVVGGVMFGIIGLSIASWVCGYSAGACKPLITLTLGAAGGATFGMVVGGLAGSAFAPGRHIWELQWRAR